MHNMYRDTSMHAIVQALSTYRRLLWRKSLQSNHGMKWDLRSPYQIRSPLQFRFPINPGLQHPPPPPPFNPLNIIVCRSFELPSNRHMPLYGHPPFLYFFQIPHFWQDFSDNIAPVKCWINTKVNSCGKVSFHF